MNLLSDTVAGAAPEIMAALIRGLAGNQPPYGSDAASRRLEGLTADVFGCPVAIAPVVSGTAANALSLSLATPPYGGILAHRDAHIHTSECGAPEFFTGGAKLLLLDGASGRISPESLETALEAKGRGVNSVLPSVLSLSQLTECGTAYTQNDIGVLAAIAKGAGLAVHLDGARLANAVVGQGVTPGAITWQAGVDLLSFGGTKNGCIAAEMVIVFNPTEEQRSALAYRRKRAGHAIAKHRFLALQLEACLTDDLWLTLAGKANRAAQRLEAGLRRLGIQPEFSVDGNEVFARLSPSGLAALQKAGFAPAPWAGGVHRFVTAFDTPDETIDRALTILAEAASTPLNPFVS